MGARWFPVPMKTPRKKRTNSFLFLDDRPKAQVCIFGWDGLPPVVNLTIPGSNGYARISFQNFEVVAYSLANIANCAELGASLSAPRTIDERAEALTRCTSTWQSCTRQMRAASKQEGRPKCLAEIGSHAEFEICSLLRFIEKLICLFPIRSRQYFKRYPD